MSIESERIVSIQQGGLVRAHRATRDREMLLLDLLVRLEGKGLHNSKDAVAAYLRGQLKQRGLIGE